MDTNRIRIVIVAAVIALTGILSLQGFLILKSWHMHVRNYHHKVRQAAVHGAHRLEKGHVRKILREHQAQHQNSENVVRGEHRISINVLHSENDSNTTNDQVKSEIIIVNGDTIRQLKMTQSGSTGSNETQVAVWNSQIDELNLEEYINNADLLIELKNLPIDSILSSELDKENIDYQFHYEILSENDSNSPEIGKYKRGQFVVPLFRGALKDQPIFLKLEMKKNKASVPPWFIAMVCFSILFSGIMIWAFWYVVNGLLKQKRISDIKSDFINNMTHEFKTPISTISLAVDSIDHQKVKNDPEKVGYYSSIIRVENKRMNKQVERVLQAAQLEKGELIFEKKETDLCQILKEVVSSFDLILKEKKGQINLPEAEESIPVFGDENHLYNMFNNLIDNAVKYCKTEPYIDLSFSIQNKICTIQIKDNGIGMSPEEVKLMFSRFYRAESGNSHNVKGFGLGLTYVKYVIEKHNGNIEVKSKPNLGSTFTLKFPVL